MTAKETYNYQLTLAQAQLDRLQQVLNDAQNNDNPDWCDVGDVTAVAAQLIQLVDFATDNAD